MSQKSLQSFCPDNDIETVTTRIEAAVVDIAPNYADWRDLGFALADALGESGRSYYHRLSRFYSGYAENETNKQFFGVLVLMMIAASRFKTHIGKLIPTPARMYWVMFGRKTEQP